MFTTLSALVANSLVGGPSVAEPFSPAPCALTRTAAHHSEGVDTWNSAYPRPARSLDAVMVFLSFPDRFPTTSPTNWPPTTSRPPAASSGRRPTGSSPCARIP